MSDIDEVEKPERPAQLTREQVRQRRADTVRKRIRRKREQVLGARVPHKMDERTLAQVHPRKFQRYVAKREGVAKKITERSMRPGADTPRLRGLADRVYTETAKTTLRYPAARSKYRAKHDTGSLLPSAPPKATMGKQREARRHVSESGERKAIRKAERKALRKEVQASVDARTDASTTAPKVSDASKSRIKARLAKFRKGRGGPAGLMGAALGSYVLDRITGGKNAN